MSKLIVMCGPPGAGKSTFSKQYVAEGFAYINQDSQGRQHLELFEAAILAGKNVIVDRLGFTKQQRSRYLDIAKKYNYETEIIVLHQPREVCLQRCVARTDHETIKEEKAAHSAINMFFSKYERVTDDEATKVTRIWPEGLKPLAVWSDLDGTLCDCQHRRHFVHPPEGTKKDWQGFFKGMVDDKVNFPVMKTLKLLQREYQIIYCSGRPDNFRKETEEWLKKNGSPEGPVYMRPRSDSRQDNITKEVILDFEVLTRYTPYLFLDDRDQVVKMLRGRGFTVFQVAEGNF